MASSQKKRVHLSLETTVKVINQAKSNSQLTVRSLAEMFGCGRTQTSHTLKNKEEILSAYELRPVKKKEDFKVQQYNEAVYRWYCIWYAQKIFTHEDLNSPPRQKRLQLN